MVGERIFLDRKLSLLRMSICISGFVTIADKRMDSEIIVWYNLYSFFDIFFRRLCMLIRDCISKEMIKFNERKNIFRYFNSMNSLKSVMIIL